MRRTHNSIHAAGLSQLGQPAHMMFDGLFDTDLEQCTRIEAGKYRHGDNHWFRMSEPLAKFIRYGLHHGPSTAGMHGHHRYAEFRRFGGSADDGVRDVVKLQIKEYASAQVDNLANDRSTDGHEKLAANFEHPAQVMQLANGMQGLLSRADIQGNHYFVFHV